MRRTASYVQADLEKVTAKSPFLQQPPRNNNNMTALFDRSEIQVAKRPLGRGGFSVVYEITGFVLNQDVSHQLTPEQQELRQHYAGTAVDPSSGRGRFVLKQLQEGLLEQRKTAFSTAASDLALEAAYLSRIEHDHILALRGLPTKGLEALEESGQHDGYFIILDRLHETLNERISRWAQQEKEEKADDEEQARLEETKLDLAWQLASAVAYLHEHGILYRDLKPQNIGIDSAGRLQLFDLGLCRQLPRDAKATDELYEMSGVGTRRYMAPEIVNYSRYNEKADVYSWSMVVWQMFTHSKPYPTYDFEKHRIHVCQQGERPSLLDDETTTIPTPLRTILEHAWCESVPDRWSMDLIQGRLALLLETEESALAAATTPQAHVDCWGECWSFMSSLMEDDGDNDDSCSNATSGLVQLVSSLVDPEDEEQGVETFEPLLEKKPSDCWVLPHVDTLSTMDMTTSTMDTTNGSNELLVSSTRRHDVIVLSKQLLPPTLSYNPATRSICTR